MSVIVSIERGGVPIDLIDEDDWRRAIEQRQLRRDTPVTLFREEQKPRRMPAGDVAELLALFDELDPGSPPARAPEQPPEALAKGAAAVAAATAIVASEAPAPAAAPPPAPASPPPASPVSPEPVSLQPTQEHRTEDHSAYDASLPPPRREGGLLVPALVLVAIIAVVLALASGRDSNSNDMSANGIDPVATALPDDATDMNALGEEAPEPAAAYLFETSFDCRASSLGLVERAICADRGLAAMDVEMSQLYQSVRDSADPLSREELVAEQRDWLADRRRCADIPFPQDCIANEYRARTRRLRQLSDMQQAAPSDGYEDAEMANPAQYDAAPPPQRQENVTRASPPRLRSGSISTSDYPERARRDGAEGAVAAQLVVGTEGRVTGCSILRSSGSAVLDSATCKLFTDRFRYEPALDSQGNPIVDTVQQTVNWMLPE
jgi:TonB family protein